MMSISKKLLVLSALSALSFGMIACDDDSTTPTTPGPEATVCTANAFKCDGQTLSQCSADGTKLNTVAICATDQTCNDKTGKCDDKNDNDPSEQTPICTPNTFMCNTNGWLQKCNSDGSKYVLANKCENATCNADAGTCDKEITEDGGKIGDPCSCLSDDCFIIVDGKMVRDAINMDGTIPLGALGMPGMDDLSVSAVFNLVGLTIEGGFSLDDIIKEKSEIRAPNYFSASARTSECKNVVAPEGMQVGCFRSETIDFKSGAPEFVSFFKEGGKAEKIVKGGLVQAGLLFAQSKGINLTQQDLLKLLYKVGDLLDEGIQFKAKNGYCLAATIDIKLNVESEIVNGIIDMEKVDKILEKINVGDFSKVATYNADTKAYDYKANCGKDSELVAFGLTDSTEDTGSADVGFAVCLKKCESNSDCREDDGYTCEAIASDTGIKKVCFDKANMDYFQGITDEFANDIKAIIGDKEEQ